MHVTRRVVTVPYLRSFSMPKTFPPNSKRPAASAAAAVALAAAPTPPTYS